MEIRFPIVPTESLEQFYTCQHLRHGDTVIDVGAYEGMYTFLGAALVGPTGKVIAVEPETKARAKLLGNLARYPFQQVQVVPGAAFSRSGSMPFYLSQVAFLIVVSLLSPIAWNGLIRDVARTNPVRQ